MSKSESTFPPFWLNLTSTVRAQVNDWPVWWKNLSLKQKVLPLFLVAFYWSSLALLNGFRSDHLLMGLLLLALSYGGRVARMLLGFLLPILLTAIIYDSQRFYSDFIRGPIHVREPYEFDKTFFGIKTAQGVLTPNEWWQLNTHPALDLVTGFFYLTFVAIFILIAGYFRFFAEIKERFRRAPVVMWSFFWVNMIGYSTYYWYAAAPPWYVALYGLGPARMDTPASPAGAIRFDELLGTHFFTEMYGRSADVFGAIPSLHVAYPFIAAYFAFHFGKARFVSVAFYLIMCFSAVYLNHHYLLDIIWGSAYAWIVAVLMRRYYNRPISLK